MFATRMDDVLNKTMTIEQKKKESSDLIRIIKG
jgi:hypothetical protein